MIRFLNKVVPLFALIFIILVGLITVPSLVVQVEDITNSIYGDQQIGPNGQPAQDQTDQNGDGQDDEFVSPDASESPQPERNAFSEDDVGEILAKLVAEHNLSVNGFTSAGDGHYTLHLYGSLSTLENFLYDFGDSELTPVVGDFMVKESSTYFYLMRHTNQDGTSIMYDVPISDLVAEGNTAVMEQLQTLSANGPSSDYYVVLTFEVPLPQ